MTDSLPRPIAASWGVRLLLTAYPRAFRDSYGCDGWSETSSRSVSRTAHRIPA